MRRSHRARGRVGAPALTALVAAVSIAVAGLTPAYADQHPSAPGRLYLVTFEGPGTAGYDGGLPLDTYRSLLERRHDAALDAVDAPAPTYRWTTALSGVAVTLTEERAIELRGQPGVATIEQNAVRRLAATGPGALPAAVPRGGGGAGVVIGVVDTGIWPESPLFASAPALGPRPAGFTGGCAVGEDWAAGACNDKLVGAGWFVAGFGEDRLAADESLSPRDVRGHGTQVASIAAGNTGVSVSVPGVTGDYRGVAPRARVAAYKACWSAPDPEDDGCATADLVTAVDRAAADGVDVLNLSVEGAPQVDTVERALLGATESGAVVVAAAGNAGAAGYATHVSPWVTTVGALDNRRNTGAVALGPDRRLVGVMTSPRRVRAPAVTGRSVPADGHTAAEAAVCTPGSLDAARTEDRIVVCERGRLGRTEKSAAVERADGVGMVLVNVRPEPVAHDLHAVPTVHLDRAAGRALTRWLADRPHTALTLTPTAPAPGGPRVAPWSPGGDPRGSVVKPDVVAPGTGLLGAVPPDVTGSRWELLSGTSAAAAWTSGAAARVLARHDWSPSAVRSALVASGTEVPGGALHTGAGFPRPDRAVRTPLVHEAGTGDHRAWLRGWLGQVNSPSLLFHGPDAASRRVTNVSGRAGTWRVSVEGFERYDVTVTPSSLTLRPGRSASYRVVVGGSFAGGLDEGVLVWTDAGGSAVRVPVVVGR